jgi:NAD(P)-dependent dehydrogenase (short-subunit alcohol dehydrogenase family)
MADTKVVLITGASSGIGEATALRLKQAGFEVYATARELEPMEPLKALGICVLKLDVTDDASMSTCVDTILQEQGRLDILINNAGYGSYGALEDVPLAEAKRQFEVNVFGLARLIQLVLPSMREQRFGKIVNISSIAGKIYEPMGTWYHATKFAVEGLSDCLRLEVQGFGIDVVIIEPGGIQTKWDGIAVQNLMKVSGHTAYQEMARRVANMLSVGYKDASSPEVIARVIEQALRARSPRTRYAAGKGARPILLLRKLLSDRLFDWCLLRVLNWVDKREPKQ